MATTTTKPEVRYEFITGPDQPRLILRTGGLTTPDGVSLLIGSGRGSGAHRGVDLDIRRVDLTRAAWLDGIRYLTVTDVVPIAELALPSVSLSCDVDPGRLADEYARQSVEHARNSGQLQAPESHAIWPVLRRWCGQSFYVGWFSAKRGGAR